MLVLPLEDGEAVLIEAIENEVDPMMDPILEKQIEETKDIKTHYKNMSTNHAEIMRKIIRKIKILEG